MFYTSAGSTDAAGIYLGSLDSSETKRLTAADSAGLYMPSGWLLYLRGDTLVARRLDPERGELTDEALTVADHVQLFNGSGVSTLGSFSVSATGVVAYRAAASGERRQLMWFDRTGKALGTLGPPEEGLADPAISPDGRRIAVTRTVQGNTDIWILDETRSTRFTFDPKADTYPIWSPDGTRIAFRRVDHNYWKPANGAGSEELLLESVVGAPSDWAPDGRSLLYSKVGNLDTMVLPLQGERKPYLYLHTNFQKTNNRFSPDGRWVASMSGMAGPYEIYVRPFPTPSGVWQISNGGGISDRWRRDGKELYYIAPDGKMMAASITVEGDTLVPGRPVALFQTHIALGNLHNSRGQYDVAPDGRFLINVALDDNSSPITLLQNWKPPSR